MQVVEACFAYVVVKSVGWWSLSVPVQSRESVCCQEVVVCTVISRAGNKQPVNSEEKDECNTRSERGEV